MTSWITFYVKFKYALVQIDMSIVQNFFPQFIDHYVKELIIMIILLYGERRLNSF